MEPQQILKASEQAISQEVRGETVILDFASEEYFSLDEVGTRVWQIIQSPISRAEVASLLLQEFDVDAATLNADLDELLERLVAEGLVHCESSGG